MLINIKQNNTYLNLQIQRGMSHQPQCVYTSEESSQYCLQQRTIQRQHLSYRALFSLENSGKDKRITSKMHYGYFHQLSMLITKEILSALNASKKYTTLGIFKIILSYSLLVQFRNNLVKISSRIEAFLTSFFLK